MAHEFYSNFSQNPPFANITFKFSELHDPLPGLQKSQQWKPMKSDTQKNA